MWVRNTVMVKFLAVYPSEKVGHGHVIKIGSHMYLRQLLDSLQILCSLTS